MSSSLSKYTSEQRNPFNVAQTFFIDPAAANYSDTVIITSVDLYFVTLGELNSTTLINDPGIYVTFCPVENEVPSLNEAFPPIYSAYKSQSQLSASITSLVPNNFRFRNPVPLKTGRKYALLLSFDRSIPFSLWTAKAGDVDIIKNVRISNDSGYVDGKYFTITNGRVLDPLNGVDLTFKLNMAKFTANTGVFQAVNKDYEFLEVSSVSGSFLGGEWVFKTTPTLTGTVDITKGSSNIVGTGTTFLSDYQINDYIVIEGEIDLNSVTKQVREYFQVSAISNNTFLSLSKVSPFSNSSSTHRNTVVAKILDHDPMTDFMILSDSTASNTSYVIGSNTINLYLANTDGLKGIDSGATLTIDNVRDYVVSNYSPVHSFEIPSDTKVRLDVTFSNSSFIVSNTSIKEAKNRTKNYLDGNEAFIASRSNEVNNPLQLATDAKSQLEYITLTSNNSFASPLIRNDQLNFVIDQYKINNDATNEHTDSGNAISKYISSRFDLSSSQLAEDLRVYLQVFKPAGTSVEVYSRLLNPTDSEDFEDKNWTQLQLVSTANSTRASDIGNKNDTFELEFAIPSYHEGTQIDGTFTSTLSNNVLVSTSTTVNTDVQVGDLIRVSSQLFPNNYFHTTVVDANTTTITIQGDSLQTSTMTNSSLVSSGLIIEKIDTLKRSAFVDNQNFNIVRYYNSSNSAFIGFQTFAVKIVMLSDSSFTAPMIHDMRAVALSA